MNSNQSSLYTACIKGTCRCGSESFVLIMKISVISAFFGFGSYIL